MPKAAAPVRARNMLPLAVASGNWPWLYSRFCEVGVWGRAQPRLHTPTSQDRQVVTNLVLFEEGVSALETRQLGNSDLQITPIGFGAWAIGGGGWESGWGPQDDSESIAAINRALDLGVNWIDTAAVYGLGHSEEVVARALSGRSDQPYVFTKCSLVWGQDRQIRNSMKPDSIRREVEASLRRLRRDVIDLYQIHWPNPDPEIEEGWATLAELQREGKVRYIGVSNFSVEQMRRAMAIAPITSLQPPYSLLRRDVEQEILPFCKEHGIG